MGLFNIAREKARLMGDQELLNSLENIPTGILMNSAWDGINDNVTSAYWNLRTILKPFETTLGTKNKPKGENIASQEVDDTTLMRHRLRVGESQLVKEKLDSVYGDQQKEYEVKKIKTIEKQIKERKGGLTETVIDTREYTPHTYIQTFKGPNGEILEEEIILFSKKDTQDQVEWLKDPNGSPIALNSDLYASAVPSTLHSSSSDRQYFSTPKIDQNGQVAGLISIVK